MKLTLLARLRDRREVDRSSLRPSALLKLPLLLLLVLSNPEPPLCCEGVFSLLSEPLLHLHQGMLHLGMLKQAMQCVKPQHTGVELLALHSWPQQIRT